MSLWVLFALLGQATTPPVDDRAPPLTGPSHRTQWDVGNTLDEPPVDLIDFLGRRRLCQLTQPDEPTPEFLTERERLHCERLPAEERAWRESKPGPGIVAWLDADPSRFRLQHIRLSGTGFPPSALSRVEQSGIDARGAPWRLVIDKGLDRGRRTRVTATFGGRPPQSYTFENGRFPALDLRSAEVAVLSYATGPAFQLVLRFGYPRGYCFLNAVDDRPVIVVAFERRAISASYQDAANCQYLQINLPER